MTSKSFKDNRVKLVGDVENAALKVMEEAAAEEKRLAIEAGDIINGNPFITVIADGSWLKRSYRSGRFDSLAGAGIIVGARTGKVIHVGVRNKSCFFVNLV